MTVKKSTKTGKNFRGGGDEEFFGWPEYIPLKGVALDEVISYFGKC